MRYVRPQRRGLVSIIERGLFAGLLLASGFVACGSDDSAGAPSDATGGSGNASTGGSGNPEGGEGNNEGATGGTSAKGGRSSTGGSASSTGGAGGAGHEPDGLEDGEDGPGYDGVELDKLDLTEPPVGCEGGFDRDSQTLELSLDSDVPELFLAVSEGAVTANGTPCTTSDGDPAKTEDLTTIRVSGSEDDNIVYVDGGSDFGELVMGSDGGIELELVEGDDTLVVLGSDDADHLELGTDGEALVVDLNGDGEVDVRAESIEWGLVTTGPKSDIVSADGVALAVDPVAVPLKVFGGGANDQLTGGGADDDLHGGIGNDVLFAGGGRNGGDHFDGGTGEDLVDYSARAAGVTITLDDEADDGEAGEGDDVDSSVEDVRGSQGPNAITGSAQGNRLWGGPSKDSIHGGDGDDFLYGGDGNDELHGDNGDDFLYGEGGDDDLQGAAGDDLLDGFPGTNQLDAGAGDGDICIAVSKDTVKGCEL